MAKRSGKNENPEPGVVRYEPRVPSVALDGQLLANAGRYCRGITLAAFEGIGGIRRLIEVANEDPKWYYEKLFSRLVQPERQVVAEAEDDVEDLLKKLDRKVIDVDEEPAEDLDDDES